MKKFPNFEKMLDRYNESDKNQIYNMLKQKLGFAPTDHDVAKEIARYNGELAGLPANNTFKDRMSLFSENPILSYHWTPDEYGDFTKRPYFENPEFKGYQTDNIWDNLGVHSGTLNAATDRMNRFDWYLNNKGNFGSIRPLIIDGDRPFNYFGRVATEADEFDDSGELVKGLQDEMFRKKARVLLGPGYGPNNDPTDAFDVDEKLHHLVNSQFLDHLRKRIFDRGDYTTVPYINDVESPGDISYITQNDRIKSPHALFDPKQFRSGNLLDARIAAPASMFQLDPKKTKESNQSAREVAKFAAGFTPVLGSAAEAAKNFNNKEYGWGLFNSAMAAAEMGIPLLAGVKLIKPALAKGLQYFK